MNKDSLYPADVRPFPKPGRRCDRKQWKKLRFRILTDSPIMDHSEQEAVGSTAIKKKYYKGAKHNSYKI